MWLQIMNRVPDAESNFLSFYFQLNINLSWAEWSIFVKHIPGRLNKKCESQVMNNTKRVYYIVSILWVKYIDIWQEVDRVDFHVYSQDQMRDGGEIKNIYDNYFYILIIIMSF